MFTLSVQFISTFLFGASLGTYGPSQIPCVSIYYSYQSHFILKVFRAGQLEASLTQLLGSLRTAL